MARRREPPRHGARQWLARVERVRGAAAGREREATGTASAPEPLYVPKARQLGDIDGEGTDDRSA